MWQWWGKNAPHDWPPPASLPMVPSCPSHTTLVPSASSTDHLPHAPFLGSSLDSSGSLLLTLRLSWASPLHIMYDSALAQPHYMDVCFHVCLIHWTMSSSRVELGPSHFSILTPGIMPTHSRYVFLRQAVFIQSKHNWTIDWLGPPLDWEGYYRGLLALSPSVFLHSPLISTSSISIPADHQDHLMRF